MRSRAIGVSLSVLLLAGMSGGSAIRGAEPATPSSPQAKSVGQLVADVGSPDYATREAATRALLKLSPDYRSEIEAMLERTSNEEAIARLEKVAVHLYMKPQISLVGPVGLMGVRMSTEIVQLDPKSSV